MAQAQVPQYGPGVDQARKAVAGAIAESRRLNLPMAIVAVAQDKAASAAIYRRPTKAFQDALAGGGAGLRVLTLRGANAVEGGLPIVVDGRIVGAIGVSGGTAEQNGVVAKAGTDAMGK